MIVAVDTGGTKTLIAAFDNAGNATKKQRFPTPAHADDYVKLLRTTLQRDYSDVPVEAIVIALPGIVKNGVALWCPNLQWQDFDAASAFSHVLGDTPVYIENDASLAGLSEARALKVIPRSALYVTVSTGIGTALITEGKIDAGLRYSEGGWTMLEYDGVIRQWQHFASGRAIYETYGKFARDIHSTKIWNDIADRISRGFLAIIPVIHPDVIIIGGSIGTYFQHYGSQLEALLHEKLPLHTPYPKLIAASHPEEAVIYGCYYYAVDTFTT